MAAVSELLGPGLNILSREAIQMQSSEILYDPPQETPGRGYVFGKPIKPMLVPVVSYFFGDFLTQTVYSAPQQPNNLIKWSYNRFPVGSRVVATNAGVRDPLEIIVDMHLQLAVEDGYDHGKHLISRQVSRLEQYVVQGGLFTVVLPSYTYKDCVLQSLDDIQPQEMVQTFRFTFLQPLISGDDINQFFTTTQMQAISRGGMGTYS